MAEKITITSADVGHLIPPPATKHRKIAVGDQLFVICPEHLAGIRPAKVLAITNEPGKLICMEFTAPVPGGHSGDGRGTRGCCLWVLPEQLHTESEVKDLLARRKAAMEARTGIKEFQELEIDEKSRTIFK